MPLMKHQPDALPLSFVVNIFVITSVLDAAST
jgi:hypothetical protein